MFRGGSPASGAAALTSGTALLDNGSKAAPSHSFASAPGVGMYWRSGTFTAFAANGLEAGQIADTYAAFISGIRLSSGDLSTVTPDVEIARTAANAVKFGSSLGALTTSRTEVNKAVTAIADNTATAAFTVTVPNAAHSASIMVVLTASLGAGGAIGANEASASIGYNVAVTRTAGVNAVATISAAFGSAASAAVAGAATCTVTGALSAISGAVGATNTFTINVTIARGSGTSTNHTCFAYAKLLNANATGVTIA